MHRIASLLGLMALPIALALATPPSATEQATSEFFENSVRPILVTRCVSCHGATQQMGNLRLDRGITPAQAQKLVRAIGYEASVKMPPSGRLSESDRAALTRWANSGASFPKTSTSAGRGGSQSWPFTPLRPPLAPPVDQARTDIDAFLLAKLHTLGLTFAPRRTGER